MGFRDVAQGFKALIGFTKLSRERPVVIDALESRAMFSIAGGVTPAAATAASTTKLSVTSPTTTMLGISTTLAARVGSASGGVTPTGRVAFYDGSTVLASKLVNSLGVARLTANYLYVGTHNLKAVYLGSSTYLGHRSSVKPVIVNLPTLSTARDGLKVGTVTAGSGTRAAVGNFLTVNYTDYLSNGQKSESTLDSGHTFSFFLGVGQVIPGWDEGLLRARPGEKRVLVVPPALAYGAEGSPPDIPPNETLTFVIEVLAVAPGI